MPAVIEISLRNDLIEFYLSGKSFSECATRFGINIKTAYKYISNAGIKRTKSEASKLFGLKLIGKPRPELRKPIPEGVKEMYLTGMTAEQIAKAIHIDKKRICEYLREHGVLMTGAEKRIAMYGIAQIKTWALHASHAAKASGGRNDPHQWAKTRAERLSVIGEGELELLSKLRTLGLDVAHQTPVGSYNIDITLNELNIAIEIHRGSWHGRSDINPERMEYLFDCGWRIIFVQISRCGAATDWDAIADKLITFFEMVRKDPSTPGQYGVLRRDGEPATRLPDYFNRWSRIECL